MSVEVYKSVNKIGNKLSWDQFEIIIQHETGNDDEDDNSPRPPKLRRGARIKLLLPKIAVSLNSFNYRAWNRF